MKIVLENNEYELEKDEKEGFDLEELKSKYTDYFYDFDYIIGDWAYCKLRLKGFYGLNNKKANNINNIRDIDKYIKNNCAYNCKYFIIKKVYKK